MIVSIIKDNLEFPNLEKLIFAHLFLKSLHNNIYVGENLSIREMTVICDLYCYGGTSSKEDLSKFINHCISKNSFSDSIQSVRNALAKGRKLGIVKRASANKWQVSKDYLPKFPTELIAFEYKMYTQNAN